MYVDGHVVAHAPGTPTSYSVAVGNMVDGAHQFCVYGIDTQHIQNSLLGCQTFTVTGAPFGHLDSVTSRDDGVMVAGWAIDPNTASPITVNLYVDGVFSMGVLAGVSRPDVGATFISSGPLHGFQQLLALSPGAHTVCAYAINVGLGASNPSLGCQTVS